MRELTSFGVNVIMKHTRALTLFTRAAVALAAAVVTMMPCRAAAQAVLNPGVIKGTIAVTGETITQSTIDAEWTDPATGLRYSASTSLNSGGSYLLTVNVPSGVTAEYSVNVRVRLNRSQGVMALPVQFAEVTALPHESVVNFIVVPGYISATVAPTSGSLTGLVLNAFDSAGGFSQGSGPGASLTFAVLPDTEVSVFGTATFTTGLANLPAQTVSVGEGETVFVSWAAGPPPPPELGALAGTFAFTGAVPYQTDINAACGSSDSKTVFGASGSFSFPTLITGPCTVSAFSYFDQGARSLFFPYNSFSPTRNPSVTKGGTAHVAIAATAAFLNGTVALTGATTLAAPSTVSVTAYGATNTLAEGGSAATSADPQTGDYRLVVTPGGWSPQVLNFFLGSDDPSAYLEEYLTFSDTQSYLEPTMVSAGQTVTKNLTYDTGKVTVNFRVADGRPLSNPSLFGSCIAFDQNGQETSSYIFSAYSIQANVAVGQVTFMGMAGTCLIEAFADVDEANTRFGALTLEVQPRTEVEIDLGGPSLTVTFPPAEHVTSDAVITVTGFASDNQSIASVTVNGVPAILTPNAPAPFVNFTFPLALSLGPNQIVTVATDTDGLTATDTRTVYRVAGPDKTPTTTVVTCPPSVPYTGEPRTPCSATVTSADGLDLTLAVAYSANVNVGTATASAAYPGDASHDGSNDSETFAIVPVATTTVVSCPASVPYTGVAQTPCTATVTSADGLNQSLTVTHSNNVNAGTANATAAYAGDANHTASDDSETFAISPIATTTVVTCPASVNYTGLPHTPCTATVTSADGLSQSLTASHADNLNAGTATANAAYSGDANHAASNDSETFTINPIPSLTVVTCPASVIYSGAAQTPCTATVTSADGLAEPVLVTYSSNVNVGPVTASAAYAGDGNHGASSDTKTFAITPLATMTVVTCPGGVNYTGTPHTPCTANVTAVDGLDLSLPVTYTANLNAGTATGSAAYAGDGNHAASNGSATFAINPLPTMTVVTCPVSVYYDASPQTPCSAKVTSIDGLNLSPMVSYVNNVNPGTATASASYGGDGNHSSSSGSTTFAIEPNATIPTTTSIAAPTITYAANGVVTVTVTAPSGIVTGNVSLRVDGGAPATKPLVSGSATFTVTQPNVGSHPLIANYAAQGNFGASTATGTLIVNQSPTATTLTSSPNPSSLGQLVTLTAVVVSVAPGSGVPVGTVTFKDGATVLGTKPVSASGQAVLTTSALTVGPHTLTATYTGNANYKPSSGTTSHLVFAYASGGGTFAIGDLNSEVGAKVTFWGAQWWKLNSLSGVVYAPAAFKGYITTPLPSPPVVGGTWQTDPGNSSNPPATVPAYVAVVVTSTTTKSGSLIAGNVVGIAIVRTDAGYSGNPGHAGSGTIVAVIR